ncbi:MAG: hypothetical protein Q9211_006016 [Gyalolechia sp. 1 TL-2023]
MPRPRPASNSVSAPVKRALSPEPAQEDPTRPSRQSKRLKSSPRGSKVTPKKSQFFSPHSPSTASEPESEIEAEASGYEDEDASASALSSPAPGTDASEESEEYVSSADEDGRTRKKQWRKGGGRGGGGMSAKKKNDVSTNGMKNAIVQGGEELWRPGVKSHLAPGEEIFVKLPKARGDGGVAYKEGIIHPNTMAFLGDLKSNNEREWLKVHDADYRQSKKDFDAFVEKMTEKLTEIDETIPELPPKDLTFRIYRDIRFSSDPTPYKTHFSAAWSRTGRKGPYAAYYLQISPGGSFVGGGLWCPEAAPLAAMRHAIDRKSHRLKTVLMEPSMRKEFLGGIPKDEKKAVGAFCDHNRENALKTKPKGYDAENPNIALLRLRNYTLGRKLKDEEVVGDKAPERIAHLMGVLMPFIYPTREIDTGLTPRAPAAKITYLNSVVMPDPDEGSESEDSGQGEE